jgi:hypothetical protein
MATLPPELGSHPASGPAAAAGPAPRPLRVLVPLIKNELAAGQAAGIEHYRRAGEMLIEAKAQVEHGQWLGWLEANFHLSINTAQDYMRLARRAEKMPEITFSTIKEATRPTTQSDNHQPAWHRPVQDIITHRVNVERLAEERQSREQEARLLRQLGYQLIDIGFKVLASKLHPDKGGSAEAMARLNRVRARLREALSTIPNLPTLVG